MAALSTELLVSPKSTFSHLCPLCGPIMAFTQHAPSDLQMLPLPSSCVKLSLQIVTLTLAKGTGEAFYLVVPLARPGLVIEPGPGVLAGARSPLPAAGGLEAAGRRPSQGGAPRKEGEVGASEGKGDRKMGSEWGKEGGVPGLRGPVPALCVGPTRGPASGRAAARMPPARSARGPRPAAPAAPRTRRAALVTGGGGRGDPGGLGVGRPGGREAVVRVAAPALPLSLLSIPHLMRRQTDQRPISCTATLSWHLAAPSPALPPIGTQTSASIHFPPTHSPANPPAQLLRVVP